MKQVQGVLICLMLAGATAAAQSTVSSLTDEGPSLGRHVPQTTGSRGQSRSHRRKVKPQTQTGPEEVLYAFQGGNDGAFPNGSLIWDSAGNLYGTAWGGGANGLGTVFELTPNGSGGWKETVLYSFSGGTDGANPQSSLIFDGAGNLYGTTSARGTSCACGTVFELSPDGNGGWKETTLYGFQGNPNDGASPAAG